MLILGASTSANAPILVTHNLHFYISCSPFSSWAIAAGVTFTNGNGKNLTLD